MIYFIRDEATQHIKIGFTAGEGEDRLRDLQTGCPGQLVLLLQIEGSNQDETAWHGRYADARARGEWFRPVPELLLAITEAKVSQLEAQNAQLEAALTTERNRLSEARRELGGLSVGVRVRGKPMMLGGVSRPTNSSDLKAENAWLHAELQAERRDWESIAARLEVVWHMLEGPAVLPEPQVSLFDP